MIRLNYVEVQKLEKTAKIQEIFQKSKNIVLGNVLRKAHAKFQEGSSIGNTQKSRGTKHD